MAIDAVDSTHRKMRDFAPVPFGALYKDKLDGAPLRLLLHLLALRTFFRYQDEFDVSDYQMLHGVKDKLRKTEFPSSGLTRNSFKLARRRLENLGYIRVQFKEKLNDCKHYRYQLVAGRAVPYADDQCQPVTLTVSSSDATYKEEIGEQPQHQMLPVQQIDGNSGEFAPTESVPKERRDKKARRCRELSEGGQSTEQILLDEILNLYPRNNCDAHEMPNPGKVKAALKNFLLENPTYEEGVLLKAIRNRFSSEKSHRQSPHNWIPNLCDYIDGPIDKYGGLLRRADRNKVLRLPDHTTLRTRSSRSHREAATG